jgi:hypothetical protein
LSVSGTPCTCSLHLPAVVSQTTKQPGLGHDPLVALAGSLTEHLALLQDAAQ